MTMALRHGCLLGAFLLLCTVKLSSACTSCQYPYGGAPTSCDKGCPLSGMTCGKPCPGNYNCAVGAHGSQGICCPNGFGGHPPPYTTIGVSYIEQLYSILIPRNRTLNYVISLHFQAPAITIADVCGRDLPFAPVNTVVTGIQQTIGRPALAIGCNGIERNLGTTIFQAKPAVSFQIRSPNGQLSNPSPSDYFCVFMFDPGTDPTPGDDTDDAMEKMTPFYLRNKPYVQWIVCNIPGNNVNAGTEFRHFQTVPSNAAPTRRMTFAVFKQPNNQPNMNTSQYLESPIDPLCLASQGPCNPLCNRCLGCRFDIRPFIQTYRLEVEAVLTVRAASDAVGLDMIRGFGRLTSAEMCGIYNQVNEEHAATEDGSYPGP